MDAPETMLVPYSTGKTLVATDMTQLPATDIRPTQPWKRVQDQSQFDHAEVNASAPTVMDRNITDNSNMSMYTQPGEALIPIESVKETPAIIEEKHLLSYIATRDR
jgi:hypothetical protein